MGQIAIPTSGGGIQRYVSTVTDQCTNGMRTLTVDLSNYSNVPTDSTKIYIGMLGVNSDNYSVTDVAIYKKALNNKVLTLAYEIYFASPDASKTFRIQYSVCF